MIITDNKTEFYLTMQVYQLVKLPNKAFNYSFEWFIILLTNVQKLPYTKLVAWNTQQYI